MALVLASASAIRRAMLEQAGLDFDAIPPQVDEDSIKQRLSDPAEIASQLACSKACSIATDAWVIGSDSVVSVDGRMYSKPPDRAEAAEHLRAFSGRTMKLTSAVALARGRELNWSACDTAKLKVRHLTEGFIADYLDAEWPEVGYCVGVFRLEGRGVQLFEAIDGSYFTILGMPLLPLLAALRERGLVPR